MTVHPKQPSGRQADVPSQHAPEQLHALRLGIGGLVDADQDEQEAVASPDADLCV